MKSHNEITHFKDICFLHMSLYHHGTLNIWPQKVSVRVRVRGQPCACMCMRLCFHVPLQSCFRNCLCLSLSPFFPAVHLDLRSGKLLEGFLIWLSWSVWKSSLYFGMKPGSIIFHRSEVNYPTITDTLFWFFFSVQLDERFSAATCQ